MSTSAQIAANPSNAQHSCGPTTEDGKAASSQNNFRQGFAGNFKVLPWEKQQDFREVLARLCTLHQPQNEGEVLYLRYQTTHDRAFHKCADELRKVRNERRNWQIGFASQKRHKAAAEHKQLNENRKQELHKWAVLLAEAEAEHRFFLNAGLETPGMERRDRVARLLAAEKAA